LIEIHVILVSGVFEDEKSKGIRRPPLLEAGIAMPKTKPRIQGSSVEKQER
jgi:hypothetical protein